MEKRLLKDPEFTSMIVYNTKITSEPNKKINFAMFDLEGKLIRKANIILNSEGRFPTFTKSSYNPAKQMKIVVLGGEQTAFSVVDNSWPFYLQKEFDKRYGLKKF
jgi:hypothetical protein